MKRSLLIVFILISIFCFSQEDTSFLLKGRILIPDSIPVKNADIVNFRNLAAYTSRKNGRFNIWELPADSLIVNHISFHEKNPRKFSKTVSKYIPRVRHRFNQLG
jgi:hypothetical protein